MPSATREMISIFQEHQHVVCCVGSSLQASNTPLFSAADVAIGFSPMPTHCLNLGERQSSHSKDRVASGNDLTDDASSRISESEEQHSHTEPSTPATFAAQEEARLAQKQQAQEQHQEQEEEEEEQRQPPLQQHERSTHSFGASSSTAMSQSVGQLPPLPGSDQYDHIREKSLSSINFLEQPTTNSFSCDMTSLPCAFVMDKNGNFETFLKLIQEARGLLVASMQALKFFLLATLLVHCIILLSYCALLPTILAGVHIIWLCVFSIPLLSFSLLFARKEPSLMKEISDRSPITTDTIKRQARIYLVHIIPTCFIVLLVFTWYACSKRIIAHARGIPRLTLGLLNRTFARLIDPSSIDLVFGFAGDRWESGHSENLWAAQNFTAVAITAFLIPLSFVFLQRKEPLIHNRMVSILFWNPVWLVAAILVLGLQLAFLFFAVNDRIPDLASAAWPSVLVVIAWPIEILVADVWLRAKYRRWHDRNQRFLRLEYDTKLGMYSPVSPFEDRWAQ